MMARRTVKKQVPLIVVDVAVFGAVLAVGMGHEVFEVGAGCLDKGVGVAAVED